MTFAFRRLQHADRRWVLLAGVSELASVLCYALLQRKLLAITGYTVRTSALVGISFATDAIGDSLPGEPLFSSAFRYRQYRRHGVDAADAAWVMLAVLVALALGLSATLLAGVVVALISGYTKGTVFLAALAVVVLVVMTLVLTKPFLWIKVVRFGRRLVIKLPDRLGARVVPLLVGAENALQTLQLGAWDGVLVGLLGTFEWAFDLGCLVLIFPALGFPIPWYGVALAYAVSQIVGVLPVTPGGLGIIEGSLTAILIALGSVSRYAITSVLLYRLISYWIMIPVGWAFFLVIVTLTNRESRSIQDQGVAAGSSEGEGGTYMAGEDC